MKKKKILQTKLALQKDRFLLWFRYDYLTLFWFLVSIYNTWTMLYIFKVPYRSVVRCLILYEWALVTVYYFRVLENLGGIHGCQYFLNSISIDLFIIKLCPRSNNDFCVFLFFLKIQLNSYQDHFMIATRSRAHRICEWSSGRLVLMRSRNLTYQEEKCIENKYSIDK